MLNKLRKGLSKTSKSFSIRDTFWRTRGPVEGQLMEELEAQLLLADVGIDTVNEILKSLGSKYSTTSISSIQELRLALRNDLINILSPVEKQLDVTIAKPFTILMVGANGSGKTTTIGKLAKYFISKNLKVMLAAGDTFRAAATEQLCFWGQQNAIPVVSQHQGADSAAVIFDAYTSASARGMDILIADTAGRLHHHEHLMEELKKIIRVVQKLDETAPHEIMLVLDAGTGQNGLVQAREFKNEIGATGLSLTKLDGTAKGGIIFAIAKKLALPIRYIGIGESSEDLTPFVAQEFVDALLQTERIQE